MMLSIDQLLETLSNPEGRFKTLLGIHLENENGEPGYLLRSGGAVAIFRVWLEERSCELSCALKNREQRSVSACLRANFLQRITAPYLVDYEFHGQEMLLFDTMGNSFDIDVVLTERPQGVGLDKALSELCDRGERGPLFALRKTFCEMASWLLRSPIVHGALKPVNVIVAPDGTCRLIRYEAMRVPGMEELSEHWGDDTVAAANLAIGLSLLCAAPALYRICNGDSLFHTPLLRSSLLPLVSDMARESSCEPLLQLVEMLSRGGFALDREQLADVLEVLACDKTDMTLPVDRLNRLRTEITPPSPSPKPVIPPATTVRADLSLYDWVGPMCEALICVQRGSKWGYLNSDGTVAIPLRYDWADDFLEGRAVIRIGDQFGLIDKEGNEVLAPVYESVDWDCRHGVACVSYEGKIGLYDRTGKERVAPQYDWMGDIRESDLLLVRKEGKCGYIRHTGEVVIPLQYDDAFDFGSADRAQVTLHGRTFMIDREGHELPHS